MKTIFFLLCSLVSITTFSQHSSHWKEIYAGSSWNTNYVAGDTIHFNAGSYGYFSGAGMNGTKTSPIVCVFDNGVVFSKGFNLTDCKHWHLHGLQADGSYNIKVNNASGVPFYFVGKCDSVEVDGFDINGAYSAVWWKTEGDSFPNDTSYWHITMAGLYVHDFKAVNLNFDGFYIGTTNQQANRPVVYKGVTYYPPPVKIKDVRIENGFIDGSKRTGLQISGLIGTPGNYVRNVTILHSGLNHESDQGCAFLLGGNSTAGITVENCVFRNSYLYAFHSQGSGNITLQNCIIDSATVNNPQQMAVAEFDGNNSPTTLKIIGNTFGYSNNNVGCVIYGGANKFTDTGNVYCNNTGTFLNSSGATFSNTCATQANSLPHANAGNTDTITTTSYTLAGSASDADGSITSVIWNKLSGPGTPTFNNASILNSTVSGLVNGSYVFRLIVTDNAGGKDTSMVSIFKHDAPVVGNIAPVLIVPQAKVIAVPMNYMVLDASGSYDPDGTITYLWTQISGDDEITTSRSDSSRLVISNLSLNTYVFHVKITDNNGASQEADVQLFVTMSTKTVNKKTIIKK